MNLSNDEQMFTILSKGAPDLLDVYKAMKASDVASDTLIQVCEAIKRANKTKNPTMVNIHLQNNKVTGVTVSTENDIKDDGSIKDAMRFSGVTEDWLLKGLFLIGNVRNVSRWGKVVYLIQDGQIVKVDQEQGFKLS